MRIAIVGPGAMGCLFGGLLRLAGHDVAVLARRAEHAEQISREGLVVLRDRTEQRALVRSDTDPARLGPAELAIVLVKASDTDGAARALPALLGADGPALTLQNGLGNVERLADVLGPERVLGGVTAHGATLLGPGRVCHAGSGPTALAEMLGGRSERAVAVAALLDEAGIPTRAADEVGPLVWGKLVANVGINPLGALLRCPNGELVRRPDADRLLAGLAQEAALVARAAGVRLPFDTPAEHVRSIARATAANRNSMLQDVEGGRRTEIDAINGAVADLGERLHVAVPLNRAMALLIRALEARACGPATAGARTEFDTASRAR